MKRFFLLLSEPFRRSIRNKLMLAMIMLAVLPVITVSALAAEKSRQSMEDEVIETNLSTIKWTGIYLGEQFSRLNSLIYSILLNEHLSENIMETENDSLSSQFTAQRNITDMFSSVLNSANTNVISAELYVRDSGKLFRFSSDGSEIRSPEEIPVPYKELFDEKQYFMIRNDPGKPGQFEFTRSVNRFENRQAVGGVTLGVRWTYLDQTLALLNTAPNQTVLLADKNGRILYKQGSVTPTLDAGNLINLPRDQPGYVHTRNAYIFYSSVDPSGLMLVKIIPANAINHSARSTMNYGFIVGSSSIVVAIIIAVYIAYRMSRPIVMLARSMQGLGPIVGDVEPVDIQLSGRIDEIGWLETHFVNMTGRIREHIKTEYNMKLEKKTAELKALQAQINPHFLQNTLQMVGSMIYDKKPKEVYKIIKSLSSMFRYVIREPEDMCSLRIEIGHLQHYMQIQKERYGSRLAYTLIADEELLECRIPKLTLQPIVENSFFHGLDTKLGDWRIDVEVRLESGEIVIRVRDNGVGISAVRLEEIRKELADRRGLQTKGSRIGLYNVVLRIRMHFGERYGIEVEQASGGGTVVTVRIPYVQEGRDEP
ncbi:sensor histidine kinase [Paenibacillus kribbensis]|uniref:sensor histidine kinase n=1 Tax=Paenibacillus kribbensis TaxID=172713 RepID=UPI000838C2F1|nr:histidine kinase [Paenibacillus kribbensis]